MNSKKRLAVIGIRGFPGVQGGVESHCEQLIPLLADSFDITVYRRTPYLTDKSDASYPGIKFVDLGSTRIGGFEAVWHTFRSILHIATHRVDAVNIHNIGPGLFAPMLRMLGIKVVLTYHSPNYEHDKWSLPAKLLLRLAEAISLRASNHVIFVSPVQRAKYPYWVQRKSSAIPNGITPIGTCYDEDFLKSFSLKKNNFILAVGRLTPEKGFDTLVKAVQLTDAVDSLVIAGASDHGDEYQRYLKSLDAHNKVTFTGYTTGRDLAQLYTHARLYCLSSHNEGFPMVLLEAMSHSLPIVATDIPAAHIIELPNPNYCSDTDPQSMAQAIETVMSGDDRALYDLTPYDWTDIARRTAAIYNKL